MKKTAAILLSFLMLVSAFTAMSVSADETDLGSPAGFTAENALFVHAVLNSADTEAWQGWQSAHDEEFAQAKPNEKFFFLPTSASEESVDIYNGYSADVVVNNTTIEAGKTANVAYTPNDTYTVDVNGASYTLTFMKSKAEAAIYINNSNADGKGTELISYLNADKSLSSKATGAIVTPDGKIDNTTIKKIKGRGNTSWQKPKKGYNVTYDSKVSIAGMTKSKKYSMLPNYQDDSLSRNRFLYDLSDAVDMPYASDSRYIDFYSDGYYWGSYLMAEKVEVGSSSLVNDFEEEDYLDADGSVKSDFPYVCEVDASANDADDYYISLNNGVKVTIKAPELEPADVGYNEVKEYVRTKFNAFFDSTSSTTSDISAYADVDSVAKLYLINELGKNWDAGVSSLFFTYKQDADGNYKFFGSPVWDYDNSLGNATGVQNDLRNFGVNDYEEYTGWWCRYKDKASRNRASSNIMNRISQNNGVLTAAKKVWFEKFVPAIDHFSGRIRNAEIGKELYTADEYYSLVKDTADMNYASGWLLNTGSWIADHSSLSNVYYDDAAKTYNVYKDTDKYESTFEDMFNYARDWMISRAAWLSKEMSDVPVTTVTGVERPEPTEPATETEATTQATEAAESTVTEATETEATSAETEATETQATETQTADTQATEPATETEATATETQATASQATDSTQDTQATEITEPKTTEPTTTAPAAKTKVTLKKKAATIYRLATYKLAVTVTNKKGSTTFKSSNTKVARVNSKGVVRGLKKGSVYITVTNNGVSEKFKLTIKNPKLSVTKKTIKVGKKFKIKIVGKVSKAKFTASNKRIKVYQNGYVKGLKKGTAIVKVKTNGITLKCKVTVKK